MKKAFMKKAFLFITVVVFFINCNLVVSYVDDLGGGDDVILIPGDEQPMENPGGALTNDTIPPAGEPTPLPAENPGSTATPAVTMSPTPGTTEIPGPTNTPEPDPVPDVGSIFLMPDPVKTKPDDSFITQVRVNTGSNALGFFSVTVSFSDTYLALNTLVGIDGAEPLLSYRVFDNHIESTQEFTVIGELHHSNEYRGNVHLLNLYWQTGTVLGSTEINITVNRLRDNHNDDIGVPAGISCHILIDNS